MFKTIREHLERNRAELEDIKLYFQKCADEIDRTNLYMLRKACMWTSIVFIGMLFLSKILIPRYTLTLGHCLMIPLLVFFFIVNIYTRNKTQISDSATTALCLLFYFSLFMDFILIEISVEPVHPSRWFPLLLIIFPALYVDRQYKYGLEETFIVVIYCLITYFGKGPVQFYRDLYTVLAAYILSMIISRVILGTRSKQGLYMLELKRYSSMDKLTHIYNKAALLSEIKHYLTRRRGDSPCAMSVIDVDNFKQVNDSLGHGGGDQLLERVGQLLVSNFRPSDIIGRFGGDEFIVFMPNMKDAKLIDLRCRSLQMQLADFDLGNNVPFSLSIGTIVDEGMHSQDDLFRLADDALYLSKIAGKNCSKCWVADEDVELSKPVLVFLTSLGEEKAKLLPDNEIDRFRIFATMSDDEAIKYLCQYQSTVKIIVVEVNEKTCTGEMVIKYAKTREKFAGIPILAVTSNEEGESRAKELGADVVLITSQPGEVFKDTIGELTKTK